MVALERGPPLLGQEIVHFTYCKHSPQLFHRTYYIFNSVADSVERWAGLSRLECTQTHHVCNARQLVLL